MVNLEKFKNFTNNFSAAIQFDSVKQYIEFCEVFCVDKTIKSSNHDRMRIYASEEELCINFNQGIYHSFARKSYYLEGNYFIMHCSNFTDFQIVYELWI